MLSYIKELPAGGLTLSIKQSRYEPDDVFDIAQRINPKRAFLFISRILGHHIPVKPSITREACQRLSSQIPTQLEGPVLFIGMAETAVALACGVYQEARKQHPNSVLLLTTRHPIDCEMLCDFQETHSHAMGHLLHAPPDEEMKKLVDEAETLVLIDDETTTGNTFYNLVEALENQRDKKIKKVIAINLTDWSNDALGKRIDCDFHSISLMRGEWKWYPNADRPPVHMPHVNVSTAGESPLARQDWGRLGATEINTQMASDVHPKHLGERILVIGTEEFVWPPFLLAERLEKEGGDVMFCATTRSPLVKGYAIGSVFTFQDNYKQGIPHFIYNLDNYRYDRIIICSETPLETLSPNLINKLKGSATTVECYYYE